MNNLDIFIFFLATTCSFGYGFYRGRKSVFNNELPYIKRSWEFSKRISEINKERDNEIKKQNK